MTTPSRLRTRVERDLRPARPLRSPARRALVLVPLALATVAAVPLLHFFRSDLAELGIARTWGLSAAEALGGVVVVAAALVESIPGRTLPRRSLVGWFAFGLALPAVVLALTAKDYATGGPPGTGWSDGIACFRTSLSSAAPVFAVATFLVVRAFAIRPGLAGALYGLGCGLVADAGLRMFCEFTDLSHVVPAHGGAIAVAMVFGICAANVGAAARNRRP